jgi:hypothetical protein
MVQKPEMIDGLLFNFFIRNDRFANLTSRQSEWVLQAEKQRLLKKAEYERWVIYRTKKELECRNIKRETKRLQTRKVKHFPNAVPTLY